MSGLMEFYTKDDAAGVQIGKDVYRRVLIPIDDFNAACDHYGFVKERSCECVAEYAKSPIDGKTIVLHRCSECHELMRPHMAYCPNCGAKVIGGDE